MHAVDRGLSPHFLMRRMPMSMTKPRKQDPLHGITLQMVVTRLVEKYGWEELGRRIKIKCFTNDPSINSCLKFLRRTPWARQQVEALYLNTQWPADSIN